jgi:hypothetical protein
MKLRQFSERRQRNPFQYAIDRWRLQPRARPGKPDLNNKLPRVVALDLLRRGANLSHSSSRLAAAAAAGGEEVPEVYAERV